MPTSSAPACFGDLAVVAGQRLRGLLALQVGKTLDVGIVLAHDQRGLGGDVGVGEVELRLALLGDADLVDDGVVALDVEAGDQPVPLAFDEFGLHAELFGDLLADLDVEADELVAGVMIGERGVSAFGADLDDAGGLDGVEVFAGLSREDGKRWMAPATMIVLSQFMMVFRCSCGSCAGWEE